MKLVASRVVTFALLPLGRSSYETRVQFLPRYFASQNSSRIPRDQPFLDHQNTLEAGIFETLLLVGLQMMRDKGVFRKNTRSPTNTQWPENHIHSKRSIQLQAAASNDDCAIMESQLLRLHRTFKRKKRIRYRKLYDRFPRDSIRAA